MTDDMIALQALLAKQPDADIVREMLGQAAVGRPEGCARRST